jgi:hypothetical protein
MTKIQNAKWKECSFFVCALWRGLLFLFAAGLFFVFLAADDSLPVGLFSAEPAGASLPQGWEPLTFPKISNHTEYSLVAEDGQTVVRAVSRGSASGLIRRIQIDPETWPVLSWRWKVANTYKAGDVTRKQGDDYPARIYVTFRYDPDESGFFERLRYETAKAIYGDYPPAAAINYIWASSAAEETAVPNPFEERAMMIAVESGNGQTGRWVTERRNILADFRRVFKKAPPPISGVAIMTDSDNTGESATAWYGDIRFHKR